jgi:hypothetical protein
MIICQPYKSVSNVPSIVCYAQIQVPAFLVCLPLHLELELTVHAQMVIERNFSFKHIFIYFRLLLKRHSGIVCTVLVHMHYLYE